MDIFTMLGTKVFNVIKGWPPARFFKTKVLLTITVCVSAFLAQADATNTFTTPVHRYSFSETGGTTVADAIGGLPWNGTLPSGGTLANGQVSLSGSGQFVSLPSGIVGGLSNFTLSAWVKLNSPTTWMRLFDFGNDTNSYMFLTPRNAANSKVRFAITTNSTAGEQLITGTSALSTGAWHQVTVTLNGTTGILYVDGQSVGTNSAMTLQPQSLGVTVNNFIGKSQWPIDPYLNGVIDEFSIYDVALSSTEISNLYNTGIIQYRAIKVDASTTYQTIEGLGGAVAFYAGWLTAHPYAQEIYTNAFAGLNISMLRLGNWFRYNGLDTAAYDIVTNANRIMRHPVPVYMSSWAPPAFLKSNGQVANGGTLVKSNGVFAYTGFANYWYDSLQCYQTNGVVPTWISIQNEPDFTADYDSCVFHPTEDTVNNTNYASYSKALDAVFQKLNTMPSPPKLLAPEVVGLGYNDVQNYAATMNSNSFYGMAHHLYGGSTDGTPDGYIPAISALTNLFPGKPRFMTEYGVSNMIEQANLIHNTLTYEQGSGYNYWSLVWPGTSGGLIQIENPWDRSTWTNAPAGTPTQSHGWWIAPAYWAMKHYSYYITPGFKRVAATSTDANVLASAYISPNKQRLVVVLINRSTTTSATMPVNSGSFAYDLSNVYQTAGTNHFAQLGTGSDSPLTLPAGSLTTVVLDKQTAVVLAANPTPANGTTNIAPKPALSWVSDANAIGQAVYFGTSSNAVANATPASPEFQGILSTNSFAAPAPKYGTTYYWRVDETTYISTNTGSVWAFTTTPPQPLPSPLQSQDIGTVGTAGDDTYTNKVYTLNGAGADIQGTADAFHFVYTTVTGDFTMIARVSSVQAVNAWSKAGIMVRDSLSANAANAFIAVTPSSGITWQYRSTAGASTTYNATGGLLAPYWLKLVRAGSTFSSYRCIDGVTWVQQGSGPVNIPTNALVGLAVCSHSTSALCAATFDNITVSNWPVIPAPPLGLTAIAGDCQINLNWPPSTGASSYNVKRATISNGPYSVITNVTITNYSDGGLNNGTTYFYVVSGLGSLGEGSNSTQTSAIPHIIAPTLNIALAGPNLTLSWPTSATPFSLMSRTNLTLGNWLEITSAAPQVISNQWQITLPASENPAFFELKH